MSGLLDMSPQMIGLYVVVLDVQKEYLEEELNGILFEDTDYKWANFICENRTRTVLTNTDHHFAKSTSFLISLAFFRLLNLVI
jgi:hypothetical protein